MTFPTTLPGPALARRAATGLALVMLAIGGTGAVTIAATSVAGHANASSRATTTSTHTSKPADNTNNGTATAFGQQVKEQVADCKAALQTGQHAIGSCVSTWVKANNPSNTNSNGTLPASRPTQASTHGH